MLRRILCVALAVVPMGLFVLPTRAVAPPRPSDDTARLVFLADEGPVFLTVKMRIEGKPYTEAWDELMDKLFAWLDRDGDGVLSREEAAAAPPAGALSSSLFALRGGAGGEPKVMKGADPAGKVTRAEMRAHYRAGGVDAFNLSFEARSDGFVRLGAPKASSPSVLTARLFALLDTNKDGKLSKKELEAAPEVIGALDADEDEMVDSEELQGRGGAAENAYGIAYGGETGDAIPADRRPLYRPSGDADPDLAKLLAKRYGKARGKAEAARFASKASDATLVIDVSMAQDFQRGMMPAPVPSRPKEDKAKDKAKTTAIKNDDAKPTTMKDKDKKRPAPAMPTMSPPPPKSNSTVRFEGAAPAGVKLTTTGGVTTLEAGRVSVAFRAGGPMADQFGINLEMQYTTFFQMADEDGNGYLDEKEADKSPLFRGMFEAMDRDGDGMLYEKEVTSYLRGMSELRKAASRGAVALSVTDEGKGLFDMLDTNGDGKLSIRELREAGKLLAALDVNRDGYLELNEVPRKFKGSFEPGTTAGGSNRAFAVAAFGGPNAAPTAEAKGPVWFRKMDRNRDGDVSRREFLGTEEEFREIDADGDGLISLEEAERYDRAKRGKS